MVPANGGDVGGSTITINDSPGDQTEPNVSGNLAVYTDKDFVNGSTIHYFDFLTGIDRVVPVGAAGDSDNLSDVGGGRIVFTRTRVRDLKSAAMFYDVASGALQELAPQSPQVPMTRFGTVIGDNTVAYQELEVGNGDIYAYDLVSGIATNLSQGFDYDAMPSVSTCTLPPATIAVTRLAGLVTGIVNESEYLSPADSRSNFRIDSCQYIYNLNAKALSAGIYRVDILIDGAAVGSANLELR